MDTTTVRIDVQTRGMLRKLAEQMGEPIHITLANAVEAYRRQQILTRTNEAYAAFRANADLWQEEEEERAAWDATLSDGLRDD